MLLADDLQGVSFLDLAVVNGKRVDFHMFDLAGSIGANAMIVDPTAPSYAGRGWNEVRLLSECECAKRNKHVLNGVTMVLLVMLTFGKLGPSAQGLLQSLTDVVDYGLWLRIAQQYLSCALVRRRCIVFYHFYQSIAKRAGKDFRDVAVVPFELMWMLISYQPVSSSGACAPFHLFGRKRELLASQELFSNDWRWLGTVTKSGLETQNTYYSCQLTASSLRASHKNPAHKYFLSQR